MNSLNGTGWGGGGGGGGQAVGQSKVEPASIHPLALRGN